MDISTKKISLFDLDKTLIKTNSSFRFGVYLYRSKTFSFPVMLYYLFCYSLHKFGFLDMRGIHCKIFKNLFKGKSQDYFTGLAKKFLDEKLNSMLYPPAMERLQQAINQNHYTVILSSSPEFLVENIAKHLNVNEWRATRFQLNEKNEFCAVSSVMDGEEKALYLQALSKRLMIPLSDCTAYSDSILDLPLLRKAGKAVGVNPDSKLRTICKENQWEII